MKRIFLTDDNHFSSAKLKIKFSGLLGFAPRRINAVTYPNPNPNANRTSGSVHEVWNKKSDLHSLDFV